MKRAIIILNIVFSLNCMAAEHTLYVSSDLKEEASSEEAILLVQCITGDGVFQWQLSEQGASLPNLRFSENKDSKISIQLNTANDKIASVKSPGELLSECEPIRRALLKTTKDLGSLKPSPWTEAAIPEIPEPSEHEHKILPWIIGGGILAGAVLFLKSRQSNFNRIQTGAQ